ncbi:MAG: NHLP bacteriocin export ABC transporter permease/ATPase subunit [Anaerocolumna sp.]
MEQIILEGGKVHITSEKQYCYQVISGTVLVYIVPVNEDNVIGRRYSLFEINGDNNNILIPSLSVNDDVLGKWSFAISALGTAVILKQLPENGQSAEKIILKFAQQINLNIRSREDFESEVVETVERKLVTEEISVYRNYNEQEKTLKKCLDSIAGVFNKSRVISNADKTQNNLYNTVAFICRQRGIKIVSYDVMVESCGRIFSIEDIARISHFMIREVQLDKSWYRHDSGYLLVYKEKEKKEDIFIPVACLPISPTRYKEYNMEDNTSIRIEEERNKEYVKTAYEIYRPLPNKDMGIIELIKFGVKAVYKKDVIFILLFSLLSTLIGLLIPYLNQVIYDEYIPFGNQKALLNIGFFVFAFCIGNLSFTIVKNIAVFRISMGMEHTVQSAVFDRLFNLPENIYEIQDSAVLVKSAFGITEIFNLISEVIITTALSAIFSLLYLYRMFAYSVKLAVIGLVMVVVNVLITTALGWLQLKYERDIVDMRMKESSFIYQFISGIAKIRIAGAEHRALLKYFEQYTKHKKTLYKKEKLSNASANTNNVLNIVFMAVFYYILAEEKIGLSFGNFMGFITAFGTFSLAVMQLAMTFYKVSYLIPIFKKSKIVLENTGEFEENLKMPGKLEGNIEVNNVSFAYKENEENVLSDISFTILSGEYVGIVGTSGSGKSSLLKLLLGFEKPSSGKIYYDEKDIECLDKREMRKSFGVVLQEGRLIAGSIYENIAIASTARIQAEKEKEAERVMHIVKEVGLDNDIKSMPMGLQTMISEGGGTISGGQRQKILIARAIFNDPRILFFDEATSALDNKNQALVSGNLEKLKITRVVIAHRLSTVKNCDRIFVMDNGRFVEEGNYEELMERKGHFYQLTNRQTA